MHLLRAVTLLLTAWLGLHAASKPTPNTQAGPAQPAPGPHDDPWAHTYRAAAPTPQTPVLQLRGFQTQQPEETAAPEREQAAASSEEGAHLEAEAPDAHQGAYDMQAEDEPDQRRQHQPDTNSNKPPHTGER